MNTSATPSPRQARPAPHAQTARRAKAAGAIKQARHAAASIRFEPIFFTLYVPQPLAAQA